MTRNTYQIDGDIATLVITQGNGEKLVITFDAEDLDRVQEHHWRPNPVIAGKQPQITTGDRITGRQLNRIIAETPQHEYCLARDGDYFNCRKSNLRNVHRKDVLQTTLTSWHGIKSGERYVIWYPRRECWRVGCPRGARLPNGRPKFSTVGFYATVAQAVIGRDEYLARTGQEPVLTAA